MQHTFFELLEEERQKGVTVFFSSHILSEVQKVCDRVAIIKQGELLKVESVSNLTRSRLKKVMITLEPGMSDYAIRLEGIMNQERDGQELRLLFNGDIKQLLSELGHMPLVDIRIEEPSLEEVFMHYYER